MSRIGYQDWVQLENTPVFTRGTVWPVLRSEGKRKINSIILDYWTDLQAFSGILRWIRETWDMSHNAGAKLRAGDSST
jgi:hypothetical protein